MQYGGNEDYQREAIARIIGREKDSSDKLANELALAESHVHEGTIPAEPLPRAPKTTKKRPSQGRALKASQAKSDNQDRIAAIQSGEVTANRVIENVKKRGAQREKKKSGGAKPRKKKARVERFEIHVSDDEEDEEGETGGDKHDKGKKKSKQFGETEESMQ